jgi:hypothetical protein
VQKEKTLRSQGPTHVERRIHVYIYILLYILYIMYGGDGGGGNFNELLRYAERSGNIILADHNSSGPQNATYRSPEIQNELIYLCGEYIRRGILDRICSAGTSATVA